MSFKKNKYKIIKNAIPVDVANFVHDYFVIKRNVFATLKNSTYISKFNEDSMCTLKLSICLFLSLWL